MESNKITEDNSLAFYIMFLELLSMCVDVALEKLTRPLQV